MSFAFVILATLFGADAKIVAPATAPVNTYVLIDGGESVGKLDWSLTDPETAIFVSPDGKQILAWCPKPRKVLLTLKATDTAGSATDWHTIRFGGEPEPAPSPAKPKPLPTPKPDAKPGTLPEGRFKISQPCSEYANQVASSQRQADVEILTKHLAELRERIKSDNSLRVTELSAMQSEVMRATKGLPPALKSRWMDWAKWWSHELCLAADRLKTAADWLDFIDETLLGLKAVRQ